MKQLSGYQHSLYANSLAEFGTPLRLPNSQGSILVQSIGSTSMEDAVGCYPLFTCLDWSKLLQDLETLDNDLVCVSMVLDPFGNYDKEYLRECFPDLVLPFKKHFVIDCNCSQPIEKIVSKHHRYYVRKALKEISVDVCDDPIGFLDDWDQLYSNLVLHHQVKGIKAFSTAAFRTQFSVPGLVIFRAFDDQEAVAAHMWYVQDRIAYSHLAASSPKGYDLMASYGLYWSAIEYFKDKQIDWIHIGAGAGIKDNSDDGLTRFKKGWSTGTRDAYFCGRVLEHQMYQNLISKTGTQNSDYFPQYRASNLG